MKNCIKAQLGVLKNRPMFKFSFIMMMLICCLSFLLNAISDFGGYEPDILAYRDMFILNNKNFFSNIIVIILPILAVIPFSDSYIEDRNKNRLPVILQYCSRKEYFASKYIATAVSAFLVIFIPLLTNLLLNAIAFEGESFNDITGHISAQRCMYNFNSEYMTLMPFKKLFISHPFVYSLIFIAFTSIYAVAGALFSYSLSYFIKNRIMIIVPFFVFSTLTNIVSSEFYIRFNIETSISNYLLSCVEYTELNYFVYIGILLILIAASLALMPPALKRLGDIVEN